MGLEAFFCFSVFSSSGFFFFLVSVIICIFFGWVSFFSSSSVIELICGGGWSRNFQACRKKKTFYPYGHRDIRFFVRSTIVTIITPLSDLF